MLQKRARGEGLVVDGLQGSRVATNVKSCSVLPAGKRDTICPISGPFTAGHE
jgi:hypothetical protein